MQHAYKPEKYTSVAPYLIIDGVAKTIDFLEKVFGAERLRMHSGDNGKLAHAEVRIDDTVVMLCDAVEGWPATPNNVHIYVPDVDKTFQLAIAAGAVPVKEPGQEGDTDRRGGFQYPDGMTWWVGTQVG
jgi:PhnB protein